MSILPLNISTPLPFIQSVDNVFNLCIVICDNESCTIVLLSATSSRYVLTFEEILLMFSLQLVAQCYTVIAARRCVATCPVTLG